MYIYIYMSDRTSHACMHYLVWDRRSIGVCTAPHHTRMYGRAAAGGTACMHAASLVVVKAASWSACMHVRPCIAAGPASISRSGRPYVVHRSPPCTCTAR
ncbi:hypothetical protein SORBI_3003G003900 [Sorghum bicolor]|uniref:Uncharacterized protein n=1 Tax=Sorghum bicolor TaxID=4558 RepID=A0A1B6Q0K6_SORBI|nr:hypothetical protein SORBI_3003G003900 [Sorghum bicolor]